jgi:hypothetical protein
MGAKDSFAQLLIDAYAAGVKAATVDIKWDGRKSREPLSGASPSGLTSGAVLSQFTEQIEASVSEFLATSSKTLDYDTELSATQEAVLDAWENGYDAYEEWMPGE